MSLEDDERFDGLYMTVAQTAQGIDPLLDTVFGFLRRKTDFFAGPPGHPPTGAEAAAAEKGSGTELAMRKVQQVMESSGPTKEIVVIVNLQQEEKQDDQASRCDDPTSPTRRGGNY
jgi:N-terminal conserved domain of Nudc.